MANEQLVEKHVSCKNTGASVVGPEERNKGYAKVVLFTLHLNICSSCRAYNNWLKMFLLLVITGERCAQPYRSWPLITLYVGNKYCFLQNLCLPLLWSAHAQKLVKKTRKEYSVSYLGCFMFFSPSYYPPTQWDCNTRFEWHLWTEISKLYDNTQLLLSEF